MEGIDVQRLLRRQHEIRQAMRRPGGVRVTDERELFAIYEQLKRIPVGAQMLPPDGAHFGSMR